MNSALIVSQSAKSIDFLNEILRNALIDNITVANCGGEARRLLIENNYDLVVINAPLRDEFGELLAKYITIKNLSEVILLVPSEHYDEVSAKVEDVGVISLSKPLNKALFWNAIKMCQASYKKMRLLQNEYNKLRDKIEDIKMVDRAKCILISYLHLSEPEAHKYIEKQAMDLRLTRKEVAEKILKSYEN